MSDMVARRGTDQIAGAEQRQNTSALWRRPAAWLKGTSLDDWITAGLLGAMLIAVSWAVHLSGWGDLPSLVPTALMAGGIAYWVSRTRVPWYISQPFAFLVIGFAIIMWQGSIPAVGGDPATRARDAWERMFLWVNAAKTGGISTDSVPFALMMIAVTWVSAYTVSWVTFEFRNPWVPAVLLGMGLLTDLSYRQGRHEQTFFLFILAAVALFAHLMAVRKARLWQKAGTSFPASIRLQSARDGLILGGIVVAVAALIPVFEVRSGQLTEQWKVLRKPIDGLREPATRLLSGVHIRDKRLPLTAPGDVLAFHGPINLTDDPIMWVTSRYSTLYPARVYQYYAPQGWLAGPRTVNTVPAHAPSGLIPSDRSRERVEQRFQPLFKTTTVLPVGSVVSMDRDVSVEVLEPPRYVISLAGPATGIQALPADVRQVARQIRLEYRDRTASPNVPQDIAQQLDRVLAAITPDGLHATLLVNADTEAPSSVVLERDAPFEQVGVKLSEDIDPNDSYNVTINISLADDEDLAAAGSNYPAWVTDRYLQLPATLAPRVRAMAQEITANAQTPYEKALAIAGFLRSQVYSQDIAGPAPDADGVDYFLFGTRSEPCPARIPECNAGAIKGYSQYYGSAATVLLRAVGVPSRMVAGWASGEYVPDQGAFIVRDRDRHGWSQVYFPEYGWIDIEVTPGRRIDPRGVEVSTSPGLDLTRLIGGGAFDEDMLLRQQDIDEAQSAALAAMGLPGAGGAASRFRIPPGVWYGLAAFGALLLAAYAAWWGAHRGMDPATRSYTQMVRAGWLFGIRRSKDQTPGEFALAVGAAAPRAAEQALHISSEYARLVYARRQTDRDNASALGWAWNRVLRSMIIYRLGSLASRAGRRRRAR
ncbi:MAG: transglutaminase domain-containing protein [Dehalococcoidia bacterium]|nr:transglutaminase domain-containing protein [Dehalococcoidia bacterium]